jgi:hypothetical protein
VKVLPLKKQNYVESEELFWFWLFTFGQPELCEQDIVMTNQPFSVYHFSELFNGFFPPMDVIACLYTVKPLSFIPVLPPR